MDDRVFLCSLQKSDNGQVLLDAVFKHLELTERDYFGLHLTDDSSDAPVSMTAVCVCVCELFSLRDRHFCGALMGTETMQRVAG